MKVSEKKKKKKKKKGAVGNDWEIRERRGS